MCYGFSVSQWLNLLNTRQVEDFAETCKGWCKTQTRRIPGRGGTENCVSMCIKGMSDEAKVEYQLKRNATSSHSSPSSISFFFLLQLH